MKILMMIRHAQSAFSKYNEADFERRITPQGERDAQNMAAFVSESGLKAQQFISSGARRTLQTIGFFNEENRDVLVAENLYHGSELDYFETVLNFPDDWNTVAICGHNPGISLFINSIVDIPVSFDGMPAGAVYAIRIHTKNWSQLIEAQREIIFYKHPQPQ